MATQAILLDSSVWIEILSSGAKELSIQKEMGKKNNKILVPTIVLYEVYKKIALAINEETALSALTALTRHHVVDLARETALTAADLSINHQLPMADAMVLAHARIADAVLFTLDNDFAGIEGVKVIR